MTHLIPCITNVLPNISSCTYGGGHLIGCDGRRDDGTDCKGCEPKTATRGEVCEACYDRIDHAIHVADTLRTRLAGITHAVTTEPGSNVPGPRLPHTAWQLDLDAINRWQNGHTEPGEWVTTEEGAREAVYFAQAVHRADRAHPTVEVERRLQRTRCPNCNRLTATWQPPDWYGDDVNIACIAPNCGWEATNPDALTIVASIEQHGPENLGDTVLRLSTIQKRIDKQQRTTAQKGAA
jgi:hypothetical protein